MLILSNVLGQSGCQGGVSPHSGGERWEPGMCQTKPNIIFLCGPSVFSSSFAPQVRHPCPDVYGGGSSYIYNNSSPKVSGESACKMPRGTFPIGLYPPSYSNMRKGTDFLYPFMCSFISPTFIGCILWVRLWDRHQGVQIIKIKRLCLWTQGACSSAERKTGKGCSLIVWQMLW